MVDLEKDDPIEFDDASDENASSEKKEASPKKRKGGSAKETLKKVRLTVEEPEDGRLTTLTNALKDRGVKNPDLGDVVAEALASVPEQWWQEKLEELTPLEWKVQSALENPDMREKLVTLLQGKKD